VTQGKVKWFNNAKGYGFIEADDVEGDVFVHYSQIQQDGFKTLKADESVQFDLQTTPKGKHATNVEIL